jgi:hypothetical protein
MRIVILTPSGGRVTMGWYKSMIRVKKEFCDLRLDEDGKVVQPMHDMPFIEWGGSDVYTARNFCLAYPDPRWGPYPTKHKEYQPFNGKLKYDKILWIDSDISFSPKDVENIIAHDADIVSGCVKVDQFSFALKYFGKMTNEKGQGFEYANEVCEVKLGADGQPFDAFTPWEKTKNEDGLVEVDACGGAFMCVNAGVYEKMEFPWYRTTIKDGIGQLSVTEDIGFCIRAKEQGLRIWADPMVRVVHDKPIPLR